MSTQLTIELSDYMMKRLSLLALKEGVTIEQCAMFYLHKAVPRKNNKSMIFVELNSLLFKEFLDVCKQQAVSPPRLIKTLVEEEVDYYYKSSEGVEEVEE